MVITSTSAVAVIIQAVSEALIVPSCAIARVAITVASIAMAAAPRRRDAVVIMAVSPGENFLECVAVGFTGANAHRVIEVDDEDLAVADLTRLGSGRDGLDDLVGAVGGAGDFDSGVW